VEDFNSNAPSGALQRTKGALRQKFNAMHDNSDGRSFKVVFGLNIVTKSFNI
jgi:hypothetical protein